MQNQDSIPYGYCHCGCGERTPIAPQTSAEKGWIRGRPIRFIHFHHLRLNSRPLAERFWSKVDKGDGASCWLWTGPTAPGGYGSIGIHGVQHRAPRLALELAGIMLKEGECALHTCDTPACVRNDDEGVYVVDGVAHLRRGHLWVGTLIENNRDMILKGRLNPGVMPGEQNGRAKLSEAQVLEILSRCKLGGSTYVALGKEYGVSAGVISKIHHGKLWAYLTRLP